MSSNTRTLSGHCLCGAVRWFATGQTVRNLICHCESCRRATASPFTAFAGFHPDQVTWQGAITHYESSPGTWRGFCPACGTRLYYRSDKWPAEIHIHAGTLDQPALYRPDAEVMTAERLVWLGPMTDLPHHSGFQDTAPDSRG